VEQRVSGSLAHPHQNKLKKKVMNQNYIAMIEKQYFRDNKAYEVTTHNKLRWEH